MELVAVPTQTITTLDGVSCRLFRAHIRGGEHDGKEVGLYVHRVGFNGENPFGDTLVEQDHPHSVVVSEKLTQGNSGETCHSVASALLACTGAKAAMVMLISVGDDDAASFQSRLVAAGDVDESIPCEALERLLRTVRDDLGLPRLVPEVNHEASTN